MSPATNRHDLLPGTIPILLLGSAAFGALCLWWLACRLSPQNARGRGAIALRGFRVAVGSTAIWLTWQVLGRFVLLETSWSLWFCAFLGALSFEVIQWLYRFERTFLSPGRGRTLLALRLAALTTLLLILVQPVLSRMTQREISREVVVLVDDSESMQLTDQQNTISGQLAIARLFAPEAIANRPDLQPLLRSNRSWQAELSGLRQALTAPSGSDPNLLEQLVQSHAARLTASIESIRPKLPEALELLAKAAAAAHGDPNLLRQVQDLQRPFQEQLPRSLEEARRQAEAKNHTAVIGQLQAAEDQISLVLRQLPLLISQLDEVFYRNLSNEQRQLIDKAVAQPRAEIARRSLLQKDASGRSVVDALKARYSVRFIRFGHEVADFDGEAWLQGGPLTPPSDTARFRQDTDLSTALEEAIAKVPAEALGGVLLLSDGRHNTEIPPEDAARQLGAQGSPLCAVAIGSQIGPRDASVIRVTAPQSIYLGDRVGVRAEVKLDGLQGQKVRAQLFAANKAVDEEILDVPEAQYRTELRFAHAPPEKGIIDYRVELEPIQGELFSNNNRWEFKCAVTDDRTNVLLVDNFPRWEFRYLRNLFYGRDKSVHLQYVLLNPDKITGQGDRPSIAASAARPFGQAEATKLPENAAEWRKFDAIILGDIPPAAIDDATWKAIRQAVAERGSLLVFVAGPRYLPHAVQNASFQELLPVSRPDATSEISLEPFRVELTQAGQTSPILQQSLSGSVNRQIWAGMPSLPWRCPAGAVKEGAEVLAYAVPESVTALDGTPSFSGAPGDVEAALEQLARRRELEQKNALLVTHRFGLGRVVLLNFDSTWRFRYGIGDTYHHKFWGQILRWGTGENLRSGGEFVRLGTDQLSYTPNSPIQVTARILDRNLQPVTGGGVYVSLFRGIQRLQRQQLTYREGSNGMFDCALEPIATEGEYKLVLEGGAVERSRQESGLVSVETPLLISRTRSPVEFAELTADHDSLAQLTQLANGGLAPVTDIHGLMDRFGAPSETVQERQDLKLWDKWPLLLLFLGCIGLEWILRRNAGLS
ncbi:MAG: hypothetical protein DVB23_000769 [Verrucomicrobia bacterium]|nr:MAG: hypothetical protein DVB23_000769 [Verrucomicrobiota bacterium]